MEYYSAIKRMKSAICSNMDAAINRYHTQWRRSGRERHEYHMIAAMWYLKYDTNEAIYKAETDSEM